MVEGSAPPDGLGRIAKRLWRLTVLWDAVTLPQGLEQGGFSDVLT